MKELIQNIEQWAEDRNLINGSTPQKQLFKLAEEIGELFAGHNRNDLEKIKDSIGDCFVVVVILRKQTNYDIEEFLNSIEDSFICYYSPREMYAEVLNSNLNYLLYWLGTAGNNFADEHSYMPEALELIPYNLIHYSYAQGLDFKDCVQHAYDQIKDRKGKMIDGVFVKEDDL